MEKISDRVKLIIENERMSTRQFEQRLGASNGLIHKAIKHGTDIGGQWISKILYTFQRYNADWLLTGEGSMLRDNGPPENQEENTPEIQISATSQIDLIDYLISRDQKIIELSKEIGRLEEKCNRLQRGNNDISIAAES